MYIPNITEKQRDYIGQYDRLIGDGLQPGQAVNRLHREYGREAVKVILAHYPVVYPDIDILTGYLAAGIYLYPLDNNGRRVGDFMASPYSLDFAIMWGVMRFAFVPKQAGLIVVDLDRGHANGGDGLREWEQYRKDKSLTGPGYNVNTHPCIVSTPSGGYHMYYKYKSRDDFRPLSRLNRNVELKHNSDITAAGSVKNGSLYRLTGSLDKVPNLPLILACLIAAPTRKTVTRKTPGVYTIDTLLNFVRADNPDLSGHDILFEMAKRLRNAEISEQEAENAILSTPEHMNRNDKTDTKHIIKSVYRGKK